MKKNYVITLLFYTGISANAQGVWTQKTNFAGAARGNAASFSIGTKGYIGTGYDGSFMKDFWEWDQVTDMWTQKADFGGIARHTATGFSIGTKGYIGTGNDGSVHYQDFWEWDGDIASPTYNTWIKKADFGGAGRSYAKGFSIGTKGYIGTGWNGSVHYQDFWEWDQATNTWTNKTNFGGTARKQAVCFSIGNKGYIGVGHDGSSYKKDFWEWDQATNAWTQKLNFGGAARNTSIGFSIGTKGYIGTGSGGGVLFQDFWEYDPATNQWTLKANFGGTARANIAGFSIGTKGYIGTGYDGSFMNDFWEYDPAGVTLISENVLENIVSVFPNPFSSQTTLSLSKEVENALLRIYDLEGNEVKSINFSGKQIAIERGNLSGGTYLYKIVSKNNTISAGKIIVL